ncbi:MAG: hypothetical protein KAV00_13605, partial [Phycisphaerae bacterium]|nr:hypothetical protein [Phycisphaerae bacterium]
MSMWKKGRSFHPDGMEGAFLFIFRFALITDFLTGLDIASPPAIITDAVVAEGLTNHYKGFVMKRVVILTALAMLASAGCSKPAGPQTTETADLSA